MNSVIILLLLISLNCFAQGQNIASYALVLTSGAADGMAEGVKWHFDKMDKTYNLNDSYWNPDISWRNKYKGGLPANGPKFVGSTTFLVWTTDGYHMARAVRNTSFVGAVVIHPFKKKKWYWYVVDFASYYLTYTVGFNITYR